jgi:hypothetical protein
VADQSDGGRRLGRRTAIQAVALVAAIVAWRLAPPVDRDHPANDLATFFTTVAAVNVTLLVSAALYQGALGEVIAFRTRRWIGPESFADFGLSLVAGVLGTVPSWSAGVYPYLFGVAAGAGLGGLLTILAMGATNIREQRQAAPGGIAEDLDPTHQS